MLRCTASVALACATIAASVSAQVELPPGIARSVWTSDDGLPQNSVSGIGVDTNGYLWVATFGGLARFDGRHFDVFDVGSHPELGGSRFSELLATRDGSVWVGGQGFGLVQYRAGEFRRFDIDEPVNGLAEDSSGQLWVATRGGMHRFIDGQLEHVHSRAAGPSAARDGTLWCRAKGGLAHIDGEQLHWIGATNGLPDSSYTALLEDSAGRLWAAGDEGVWRSVDEHKDSFAPVPRAPKNVRALAEDRDGRVWIAATQQLVCWDPVREEGTTVSTDSYRRLVADPRGNIWAAGITPGLACYRPTPLQDANSALGNSTFSTWVITGDDSGRLYVGRHARLVTAKNGSVTHHNMGNHVRALTIDSQGALWIGVGPRLKRLVGDEKATFDRKHGLEGPLRAIVEDARGDLWVGTTSGVFRRTGQTFTRVHPELTHVIAILDDGQSGLWIGGRDGLAHLTGDELTRYTQEDGLSPGVVRTLHLDDDNVLWVGTYGGGLTRLERGSMFRFSSRNGLADDHLACILEDEDGRLWINSNRGPFVVQRSELNSVARGERERVNAFAFRSDEGAREANGGSQPAGWRGPDGRMWFPDVEGVTLVDPSQLAIDEPPPRVFIERLDVSAQRELSVRFSAIGFSAPERVRVQYRLVAEHENWIEAGTSRAAHYPYVRPGELVFEVRARNGFGPWSEVASETARVVPRLHERRTFIVAVVLAACAVTYSIARVQVRRAQRRAQELTTLIAQRELAQESLSQSQKALRRLSHGLLNAQEGERRRISSELHDDVTQRLAALAIQAEVVETQLEGDSHVAPSQLHEIATMAQQLAGDVQQLSRRLHPVGLRTLGLTEAIRQECSALTRRGGPAIRVRAGIAADEISEGTTTAAFRILQESLHNIEKHARASAVEVSLEHSNGELALRVRDFGCGFPADNGNDNGLGLITMRERAASVGGRLSIDSSVGQGTTLEFRAPVQRPTS